MKHNKKFVFGMTSLIRGRVRNDIAIGSEVLDEINGLISENFFKDAPFSRVDLSIRYGTKTQPEPEYQGIDKDGWLDIAVELEMAKLQDLDRSELKKIFKTTVLDALIAVTQKYNLSDEYEQFHKAKEALNAGQ